jgi:hypothetical protein
MIDKMFYAKHLSEYEECRLYWDWSQLNPLLREYLVHHVNEGKRSKRNGHMLNIIGMRKGVPDYQLFVPNKNYHGFCLEMKTKEKMNRIQPLEQVAWIKKLRKQGYYANFSFGADDAIKQTLDYLKDMS